MVILKTILKYLLCAFFVGAGVMHFVKPEFFLKIMPPYLPWHLGLVYVSGIFEIVLGILVIIPKYTRLAAWGLIALLIAVFPANIYLAMNPQIMPDASPTVHLIRLPFQLVFIAWAWWFTRPDAKTN
ncbi:MAG: DoxX family protein [Blastocatellia bacterium]|nr:DoxX family protein [Blastocatellia bacterium]